MSSEAAPMEAGSLADAPTLDPTAGNEVVIRAEGIGKLYAIFSRPEDRLKQMLLGRLTRRRWYREHWALQDVSFSISRGEAVGIVGRNGAGKSTLLQLITGIVSPTVGHVSIRGRVAALLELGAGFNPEFTGRENVYLSASLLGLTQEEIDERFGEIEAFADIGMFIDQPVKFYSSGMYARLAFAVAAHVDADVLIIDEILSVGDVAFNQKCMRFIKKFKETGTLLFVTHDTRRPWPICVIARSGWMGGGCVKSVMPRACPNTTWLLFSGLALSNGKSPRPKRRTRTAPSPFAAVMRTPVRTLSGNISRRNKWSSSASRKNGPLATAKLSLRMCGSRMRRVTNWWSWKGVRMYA